MANTDKNTARERARAREQAREQARRQERMRAREQARAQNGEKHQQKRGGRKIILIVLLLGLVVTFVALSFTVFFKIDTIEVSGDSRYSSEQIINASGVLIGDNLLVLDSGEISSRVSAVLPYVRRVKLNRAFPSKLVLEVVPAEVERVYLCETAYAWCDSDDKVLELNSRPQENATVIKLEGVTAGAAGEYVTFADPSIMALINVLYETLDSNGLAGTMTVIDLTDLNNISMIYQNRIMVELGSQSSLAYKMQAAALALLEEDNSRMGTLKLSTLNEENTTYYFQPGVVDTQLPDFTAFSEPEE